MAKQIFFIWPLIVSWLYEIIALKLLFVEELLTNTKSALYNIFNFNRQVNYAMKDDKIDTGTVAIIR